jgi:hypothetical protein
MADKRLTKETAQHTHFATMARELGCDESEAAFNAKLEKVARAAVPRKPVKSTKPSKPEKVAKVQAPAAPEAPAKKKIRFNLPGA